MSQTNGNLAIRSAAALPGMPDYLTGQTIRRVETQVRGPDGRLGLEVELASRDLVTIWPIPVDPAVTAHTGVVATLHWQLTPAAWRRALASPTLATRRYHAGDGSEDQQTVSRALVGQVIAGLDTGGLTAEGYGVTRVRFQSGRSVLATPLEWRGAWVVAFLLPGVDRRLILPGLGFLEG